MNLPLWKFDIDCDILLYKGIRSIIFLFLYLSASETGSKSQNILTDKFSYFFHSESMIETKGVLISAKQFI